MSQKIDSSELMQCNGPGRGRPIIPSNGNPTGTGIPAGRVG